VVALFWCKITRKMRILEKAQILQLFCITVTNTDHYSDNVQ